MRTPPKYTGLYRVRRGLFGKAILQRQYTEDDFFMGWEDVAFDKACPAVLVSAEKALRPNSD